MSPRLHDVDVEELIDDWDSIRQGYFLGEHDETLLACVEELRRARAAEPREPDAVAFFTFGLVLMYGHVMSDADSSAADQAVAALSAVASDPAVAHSACGHETHPYDSEFSGGFGDFDEYLESFPVLLSLLAGDSEYEWADLDPNGNNPAPERHWRCPHNVAGFARSAATAIGPRPGED